MAGSKAIIALALAISVGILAVIAATLYLDRRAATPQGVAVSAADQPPPPPPIPTKAVAVLTKPLKQGMSIQAEDLKLEDVPLHALPPNHIVNPEDLIGRRVAVGMAQGDPVVLDKLIPREQDIEMAGLLIDGMRAYSLNLSTTGEVSGFVLPGNRVDILLSGSAETGGAFSRTVLQNIKVLAIAQQRFVEDRTVPRPSGLVTLEVTPQQAELLDMARSVGTLSFALRAQSDRTTSVTLGARQEELHGSKPIVEVIRGTVRSLE